MADAMALEGILPLTTVSWMALMTFDMGFSVKIKLFPVVIGRYCSGPPWVSLFSQPQTPTRTPLPLVPAVPTRPVFTSPHFLPSRASRSQRLALAVLVLVGASSVWFQLSAGRCRAVFAFPVRCETIIANSLIVSQCKFAYSIITR